MEDNRIARRYAAALFETAVTHDVVQSVEEDLSAIVGLLENDARFREFFLAPITSREEKIAVAERVFSDRITALTMQLLRVMLGKRRETELPGVRTEYVELRREKEGVVHVVVTSAQELPEDQRTALVAKLGAVLGRKIEPEFNVDSRLMGGVRVQYENFVLDGSVRGSLDRLRERLRYDLLKQA